MLYTALVPAPLTIVVSVREGYSRTRESLESLLSTADRPFKLVFVATAVPRQLRHWLEQAAKEHEFTLIETGRYLHPNVARNVGLAHAEGDYIVFVDNDILFEPHWLSALVDCAERTGAAIVGPLYFVGRFDRGRIHMAGGECRILELDGGRDVYEVHHFHEGRFDDIAPDLRAGQTEIVEYHCMLVRRLVFDLIGPLDEGLLSRCEQTDLCLKVRERGLEVWLEPAARVAYMPTWGTLADYLCWCYRWRDSASSASLDHFSRSWQLVPDWPHRRELERFPPAHRAMVQPRPRRVNALVTARVAARVASVRDLIGRPPRLVVEGGIAGTFDSDRARSDASRPTPAREPRGERDV